MLGGTCDPKAGGVVAGSPGLGPGCESLRVGSEARLVLMAESARGWILGHCPRSL